MSEYQYYEFAAIDRMLTHTGENHDRFGMDDGNGWMRRLAPLRDELLRGDLRPLYLGWLAAAVELRDDRQEPEVPPGLSSLSPPQQALVEFIEIDPDMLAAAAAGSPRAPQAEDEQSADLDPWLDTWRHEEMTAMLKLIAQGQGRQAERHIRSHHAAWLKAHNSTSASSAPRRNVRQLRQLAQSASGVRRQREAEKRKAQEAEHRRQREAALRLLLADADQRWADIDALAQRGSASMNRLCAACRHWPKAMRSRPAARSSTARCGACWCVMQNAGPCFAVWPKPACGRVSVAMMHADKTRMRVIDFFDANHPALTRMWVKRQRSYQATGHRVPAHAVNDNLSFNAAMPSRVLPPSTQAETT